MRNYLCANANDLIAQASTILEKQKNSDYITKILAVQSVLRGTSIKYVARSLNVTERAVQIWVKKVIEGGYPELERKKGSGRPKKLSEDELDTITDWLVFDGPSIIDPEAEIWTGKLLSKAIYKEFRVSVTPKWCSDFMKKNMDRFSLTHDHLGRRYHNYKIQENQIAKLRDENKALKKKNKELRKQLELSYSKGQK